METGEYQAETVKVLDEMTASVGAAREVIKELMTRNEQSELDTKDGISLLSMKCHLMLSYVHSLTLLGAHRVLGHSLKQREPPAAKFSEAERAKRGANAGDLVDALVQDRLVLEKVKGMEGRMKYQIDKLLRMADEEAKTGTIREDDPLAFRPNPSNFAEEAGSMDEGAAGEEEDATGIYKPPRVAPVPYVESNPRDKNRRAPVPAALSSLQHMDSSAPFVEKTSGLGAPSTIASARARELQRMTEFEEENMMRLVMNKKENKRRKRDEADIALGGSGVGGRGRQRGGLEDEFRDILTSVGKSRSGPTGDGYEELRQQGKRKGMFERAKGRNAETVEDGGDNPRKKARFEQEVRRSKKKLQSRRS